MVLELGLFVFGLNMPGKIVFVSARLLGLVYGCCLMFRLGSNSVRLGGEMIGFFFSYMSI